MQYYELGENYRIAILPEDNLDFESVVGDYVGLVWLNPNGDKEYKAWDKESPLSFADFAAEGYASFRYKETRLKAYARYLSITEGFTTALITLQGYSQGEWAEALVYLKGSEVALNAVIESVRQWWRGDVFGLQLQELKTFTADDSERLTLWRDVEDTREGGYLLEFGELDAETARHYAETYSVPEAAIA